MASIRWWPLVLLTVGCKGWGPGPTPVWDPDSGDLFGTPWPTDARLTEGTLDLEGFPNPHGLSLIETYIDVGQDIDGWGNNSPVYIAFDGPLDTEALPDPEASMEPGSPLVLVDIDPYSPHWGERYPLQWHFTEAEGAYSPPYTLAASPLFGFPLRRATTYALIVTTDIAKPSSDFAADAFDEDGSQADLYAPLKDSLFLLGLDEDEVAVATVFTTQDPVREMATMSRFVRDNIEVPNLSQELQTKDTTLLRFRTYEGSYLGPVFQHGERPYSDEGGGFAFGEEGTPLIHSWDDMRFTVSTPIGGEPPEEGYPIVVYAHGTGGDYDTFANEPDSLEVAAKLSEIGMVGIGIDQPLHGTRAPDGTNISIDTFNFENPESARANFRQGALDSIYLVRALTEHDTTFTLSDGAQIPIDRDRVLFFGHSQGGLTGALALPFIGDQIDGAVLSGAGGGLAITVVEREDPIDIAEVLTIVLGFEDDEELHELHPVVGLLQTLVEVTDPINYAPYWYAEQGDWDWHESTSVLLTSGHYDAQTPYRTADALAAAGRLPLVEPDVTSPDSIFLRGLSVLSAPVATNTVGFDGDDVTAALSQWDDADHYVLFVEEEAADMYRDFLASAAEGTPSIDPGLE